MKHYKDHNPKGVRWTIDEITHLQATLNMYGLIKVSDALGSLMFEIDSKNKKIPK